MMTVALHLFAGFGNNGLYHVPVMEVQIARNEMEDQTTGSFSRRYHNAYGNALDLGTLHRKLTKKSNKGATSFGRTQEGLSEKKKGER